MRVVLTISKDELNQGVHYKGLNQSFNVRNKKEDVENKLLFMTNSLMEEVMEGSKKQRKKKVNRLRKLHKGFVSLWVGGLSMSPTLALAETVPSIGGGTANVTPITPQVVMEWGVTVSLIAVAVGVALSGSLLALAGIFRMLRKREEAIVWTTDIIKGLVQVLISVPTVYVLFYLAQLVFKSFPILEKLL